MPIHTYRCNMCNKRYEELYLWGETILDEMPCQQCTDGLMVKILSVPNLDSTSKTHRQSINGYYSKALGGYVSSRKEEEKIMHKGGYVCEADLGDHFFEDKTESIQETARQQEVYIDKYKQALKEGKTKQEAAVELAPSHDILSGKTDNIWKE